MLVTAERLRELMVYDPETGLFAWRDPRWGRHNEKIGNVTSNNYLRIRIDGKPYMAHRLAWLYVHNNWPPVVLDHKDNNGLNNALRNLRLANFQQNSANQRCMNRVLKGITFNKPRGRWQARIMVDGVSRSLGYYTTPEAAHKAYVTAATRHFGEFARAS